MNLRQLQYFCEVAQTENIARVAQKYMVPASAVSVAIKHLEEELGTALFDRSANKLRLNEKGKLFAREVEASLSKMEEAVGKLSEKTTPAHKLKVLIKARPRWITELITQFKQENPHISFVISNDYAVTDIENFDVIIDEDSKQYRDWDRFLLSTELLCIKASAQSPLVNRELTFQQLQDRPFILPSAGNGMRRLYERLCREQGMTANVAIECNDRQCLQYYVQADMGLTIGAYRALADNTQNGIVPLKVTDFNEIQSVCVFFRQAKQGEITKAFCDFLYSKRYYG